MGEGGVGRTQGEWDMSVATVLITLALALWVLSRSSAGGRGRNSPARELYERRLRRNG